MIWRAKDRDYYRWHRRIAWLPKRIGPHRIWLERYAWRQATVEERRPYEPEIYVPVYGVYTDFIVMMLPNGYTVLREREHSLLFFDTKWHAMKPQIREVA